MFKNEIETKMFTVMSYLDFDSETHKPFYYLRLIPSWVNLEPHGFSHGISITGARFETEDKAMEFANKIAIMLTENEDSFLNSENYD